MFVEYMSISNKDEAKQIFDVATNVQPDEKNQIYVVKEGKEYYLVLKQKKGKTEEQKWSVCLEDKGVSAKRVRTKAYRMELLAAILSGMFCIVVSLMALWIKDMAVTFIWMGLVFLLCFLFITWLRFFQKSIAVKIYLIRMI